MADKDLAPYDPSKLMDAVRDRIKAEFVGLIPEDAWKKMVDAEVKNFFEKPARQHYESESRPSQFQKVIWEEVEKRTRKQVADLLASEEWNALSSDQVSKAVKDLVVEKSGEILSKVVGGALQDVISNMRQRLM